MKKTFFLLLITITFLVISQTKATIVIGGSTLESPPPFWENSYWGMPAGLERAFPFTPISGGPYCADELQVAVFHYEVHAGSSAVFSLHLDNNGQPGQTVGIFETSGITTDQQIVSIAAEEEIILYSDSNYWLVGRPLEGPVNWNLADNVFGTVAYREDQGDWVILQNRNVSAFAILGSPVPEPSTLLLLGLGGLLIRKR